MPRRRSQQAHEALLVAERAPDHLFVHAGVVGWENRAIVMPGTSFAGKTTLVQAWLEAGATYYSDEFAVLDRAGRVHPFARPLSIRDGSAAVDSLRVAGPPPLGAEIGTTPLPIGLVLSQPPTGLVLARRPRRLTPAPALLALMRHTVAARGNPEPFDAHSEAGGQRGHDVRRFARREARCRWGLFRRSFRHRSNLPRGPRQCALDRSDAIPDSLPPHTPSNWATKLPVYDWARAEVHALNPTAGAGVGGNADGRPRALRRSRRSCTERPGLHKAKAIVDLTLTQLAYAHLLGTAGRIARRSTPAMTRRWLLGRGVAAAMLPAIYSIVAPSPLEAQSTPAPSPGAPTLTSVAPNQGIQGTTVGRHV